MGEGFAFFDIIFFALVAAFIFLRLRGVLGRRTGQERPPSDPYSRRNLPKRGAEAGDDKVIPLPGRGETERAAEDGRVSDIAPQGSPLAQALTQIKIADRSFETASFLEGAKAAYEMVVSAFAAGDRDTLRRLVSDEVFQSFDSAIRQREEKSEKAEITVVGIKSGDIIAAALNGRTAEITVKFVSEIIGCTRTASGDVVEGHPTATRTVTDIWTFARDTRARDPNWTLIATSGGA